LHNVIRVLIADDHAVVRKGLHQIISETGDIIVAGEAINGTEVLDMVASRAFDVVLLDISMPGMNGIDVLRILKRDFPSVPVLILTMFPEEQFATRALQAGASGYMTKESAPTELVQALRKVAGGGKYISSSLAEHLAGFVDSTALRPPHEKLSDREFEVLRRIASGRTVSEVADELGLSVKTVSTYRSRIMDKLQLKSTVEIIRYGLENDLVD
jgi:two-component system invasion response regulator UvrY